LVGLAANAACEKLRWKFFFGPMSLIGTPYFEPQLNFDPSVD
jgi:hypothetical protein